MQPHDTNPDYVDEQPEPIEDRLAFMREHFAKRANVQPSDVRLGHSSDVEDDSEPCGVQIYMRSSRGHSAWARGYGKTFERAFDAALADVVAYERIGHRRGSK